MYPKDGPGTGETTVMIYSGLAVARAIVAAASSAAADSRDTVLRAPTRP